MKPFRHWSSRRKLLAWLVSTLVAGLCVAVAAIFLAPPEWPLFRVRYQALKFLSMKGYDIANDAINVRHPLFVEALVAEIAYGSSLEAGWGCSMSQTMFMRGSSSGDAAILKQLEGPIIQLLERETNSLVRCLALGVVAKSDELARVARKQVLESLNSSHLWEAIAAVQVVVFQLREESLARPLINRLLDSDQDMDLQEGLSLVSVMPDLSAYRERVQVLQGSTNPAIRYQNYQIKRRLDSEAEWFRKTNAGGGVR